jgi:hypothetical protein
VSSSFSVQLSHPPSGLLHHEFQAQIPGFAPWTLAVAAHVRTFKYFRIYISNLPVFFHLAQIILGNVLIWIDCFLDQVGVALQSLAGAVYSFPPAPVGTYFHFTLPVLNPTPMPVQFRGNGFDHYHFSLIKCCTYFMMIDSS